MEQGGFELIDFQIDPHNSDFYFWIIPFAAESAGVADRCFGPLLDIDARWRRVAWDRHPERDPNRWFLLACAAKHGIVPPADFKTLEFEQQLADAGVLYDCDLQDLDDYMETTSTTG